MSGLASGVNSVKPLKFCSLLISSALSSRFTIQVEVKVTSREDLSALAMSDSRIALLYSTRQEGSDVMRWAGEAGLTGDSFVWVATQSVIGEVKEALPELPAGMLGESTKF